MATVERLAEEGASVAIFDIDQQAGEKAAADLTAQNLRVTYHRVNVAEKEECMQAATAVAEENQGQLHYLVNCAAYFGCKGVTAEKRDWDETFSVNAVGYSNTVQACLPHFGQTLGGKSVVNIASVSGHVAQPSRWTYSSSKGSVLTMTKCMALDLGKEGIRVNSVSPAWVWTPLADRAAVDGGREKWEPVWGKFHMLKRVSDASEVASAVCFLLSDDASFVTGTDLRVDGGYCSMGPERDVQHQDNTV